LLLSWSDYKLFNHINTYNYKKAQTNIRTAYFYIICSKNDKTNKVEKNSHIICKVEKQSAATTSRFFMFVQLHYDHNFPQYKGSQTTAMRPQSKTLIICKTKSWTITLKTKCTNNLVSNRSKSHTLHQTLSTPTTKFLTSCPEFFHRFIRVYLSSFNQRCNTEWHHNVQQRPIKLYQTILLIKKITSRAYNGELTPSTGTSFPPVKSC
jgi:hypothetical protein